MLNSSEENGIFGYENSKRKKIKETILGGGIEGYNPSAPLSGEQRSAMINDAQMASAEMGHEAARWETPIDKEAKMLQHKETARNFLLPSAHDEVRRRRLFATADNVVSDAAESFFQNNAKGVLQNEKKEAEKRAMQSFRDYSSVPAVANEMTALGALRRESDPQAVIERSMQKIDNDELDKIANSYASYARISPARYRKEVLEPEIRKKMYDEYVKEATPTGSAEYIARSAYNNSLMGKMMDISMNAHSQTNSQSIIDREGLAAYDANRMEKLASGIGSLLVDMPMFSGIGSLSSATVKGTATIAKGISSSLAKKYAAKGLQQPVAERMVEQAIKSKMAAKIAGTSATQALTLGGYDAGNSIADDLLHNDGIDIEKAVKAYGHGLATGAAVGLVGTPLKMASHGLTGGKKIAASTGVLGAESAVFTASSEIQKKAAGVDIEPIDLLYDFGESAATLVAMRLAHWRPKGGYAKLNANGKLKEELNFTESEKKEMQNAGVEPLVFIDKLESVLSASPKEYPTASNEVKAGYGQMMANDGLSASTRSKLLYLIEDKISSTPPVPIDYSIERGAGGRYKFSLLDAFGGRISTRENLKYSQVQDMMYQIKGVLRRNKIATLESELLAESLSENYFVQAGKYVEKKGVNPEIVIDAMYKKANKQPLSPSESSMLDEISESAGYRDNRLAFLLQNVRRDIEKEYNLEEGSLLDAVERKSYLLSPEENTALDDYLNFMKKEMKNFYYNSAEVREAYMKSLDDRMKYTKFKDQGHYETKLDEHRRFLEKQDDTFVPAEQDNSDDILFPIEVPKQWTKPYAWSVYGIKNSADDIAKYESHAMNLANRFGCNVQLIRDARTIPFDGENVVEYNKKLRSLGWVDYKNNKICLNLPNISNLHELEKAFAHEVVGHKGLYDLLGNYLYEFYESIYNLADPSLRKDIHSLARERGYTGHEAVEEYLAELAEKNSLTAKETTMLNRFKGFIKNMFVEKKLYSSSNQMTKNDLLDFLQAHKEAMLSKKKPAATRRSLLKQFPSLRNVTDFDNREAFETFMAESYPDQKQALAETPSFMWRQKKELLDNYRNTARDERPISYRFVGERGAARLANSEEYKNYLRYPTSDEAKRLMSQGVPRDELWRKTGWEVGVDGKMRTEIGEEDLRIQDLVGIVLQAKNPSAAAIYNNIKEIPEEERTAKHNHFLENIVNNYKRIFTGADVRLRHLLHDPLLYTAYPDIANISVEVSRAIDAPCVYDVTKDVLYVRPQDLLWNGDLKKQIVRETQHMIQKEEEFASSIDLMRTRLATEHRKKYREISSAAKSIAKIKGKPEFEKAYNEAVSKFIKVYKIAPDLFLRKYPTRNAYMMSIIYKEPRAMSSDVEAQNAYNRQTLSPAERLQNSPSSTEAVPRIKQVSFFDIKEVEKMLSGPVDIIEKYSEVPTNDNGRQIEETDFNDDFMRSTMLNPDVYRFFENQRRRYISRMAREELRKDFFVSDDDAGNNKMSKELMKKIAKGGAKIEDLLNSMSLNDINKTKSFKRRKSYLERLMGDNDKKVPVSDGLSDDFFIEYGFDLQGRPVYWCTPTEEAIRRTEEFYRRGEDMNRQLIREFNLNDDFDMFDPEYLRDELKN